MVEFLESISLFPLVLTVGTYMIGVWLQKKLRSPLCNPILISVILVIPVLLLTGYSVDSYQAGTKGLTWLLTPATVCLAVPLYEQLKALKKNLPAIIAGVAAGAVASLVSILLMCHLFGTQPQITISLLPKSITTSMGSVLSAQSGGIEALTTGVIMVTGILGALFGTILCKLFRFTDPVAQGVAFGTASHVVGTSKANELSPLTGAVSSLSLAIAGILTAILFPLACMFI